MASPPMRGMPAGINESVLEGGRQVGKLSEILIVAGSFSGEDRMERMVKIITPLRVQSISTFRRWSDDPAVVQIAFSDQ